MTRRPPALLLATSLVLCAAIGGYRGLAHADAPPIRPAEGDVQDKARKVWDAIVHDDPSLASSTYFPREPFLAIKDMKDPGHYYDRLRARFDQDIHTLHKTTPELAAATYVRFELAKRGGYVRPHEEGNRLPYWASRHSRLFYRVGKQERSLEVRVLIAWDGKWYVIHLNEFH